AYSSTWPPPSVTLFPYTTLFRSYGDVGSRKLAGEMRSLHGAGNLTIERSGAMKSIEMSARDRVAEAIFGSKRDELLQVGSGEVRSEEHTSELQSLTNLVCRLLLE